MNKPIFQRALHAIKQYLFITGFVILVACSKNSEGPISSRTCYLTSVISVSDNGTGSTLTVGYDTDYIMQTESYKYIYQDGSSFSYSFSYQYNSNGKIAQIITTGDSSGKQSLPMIWLESGFDRTIIMHRGSWSIKK